LLLVRKHLIEAALANASPYEGAVCRAMKVGKGEIMGLLAAVEAWRKLDLNALNKQWFERVKRIATIVATAPGVQTSVTIPEDGNLYPTLTVSWGEPSLVSRRLIAISNSATASRASKF
jgi:L-seryl-tRNA(Ser) seleniumtransferase